MEAWRKTALCTVLLALLIAASSEVAFVDAASCWKEDNHHTFCFDADCMKTCRDHGNADGRCTWGRSLLPYCECLAAEC